MSEKSIKTTYLEEYTPPDFLIETVELRFELDEEDTLISAKLMVARNNAKGQHSRPLVLDGRQLTLDALALDGQALTPERYTVDDEHLTIPNVPDRFELGQKTRINPQANTSLEGLYRSSGTFCTQCEAQGFRKIIYFLDRPDVMATYSITIVADEDRYPVLLSNGNPIERGRLDGSRHWVTWEDPFRKPSYLFALVAGDLVCVEDTYVTASGRTIPLQIYVEQHNTDRCHHAMQSLKRAMRWEEQVFGLEYDLDVYMIVAVDDFNMGAMENKGLNIFNSKYVLAKPETATDTDYTAIEGVIGHEYFHNWTGNRVTCRDWFQLSLKEGLTVFRDQEFSADMGSRPVKRISEVRLLRTLQFSEDKGPMAHPVRPQSYIEISNFYTATIYNKGAEVIRMIHTLLGGENFQKGIALYIQRHDGQAVTTEDFLQAMQDASGIDLRQFRYWYDQAGTPTLSIGTHYDSKTKTYSMTVTQSCPPTPGQPNKEPFHIPLAVGLLGSDGKSIALKLEGESTPSSNWTRILSLRKKVETFRFSDVPTPPVPSLLRNFSAPVKLDMQRTDEQLAFLLAHDTDPFSRWDAGQELATNVMLRLINGHQAGREPELDEVMIEALAKILRIPELNQALVAEILRLPTEVYLAECMKTVDVDAIHFVRQFIRQTLATRLHDELDTIYRKSTHARPYTFDPASVGQRALANLCLSYLVELGDNQYIELCARQFYSANNMTDSLSSVSALANIDRPERREVLESFYRQWNEDTLVMDKWFVIQATSHLPNTLEEVKALTEHPSFEIKNPNRVRALIGAFCHTNQVRFHDASGEGYKFLADHVLKLDGLNPQVAARLISSMNRWRSFDENRQQLMRNELERILNSKNLSNDTYEIASKVLS